MKLFEADLGPEGKVSAVLEDGALKLDVEHHGANGGTEMLSVSEPIAQALLPLVNVAIDKIEQLVPGDQTGLAQKLKDAAAAALA